tara:strand:- start:7438 stop:7707 length:270 start_codon:yes stop_codon:yes gene_type:complete
MKHIYSGLGMTSLNGSSSHQLGSKIRKKLSDGIIQMAVYVAILLNSGFGSLYSIPSDLRDLAETSHEIGMFRNLDPIDLWSSGGSSRKP